jgi:uncharacterized membrane protein YqjE
MATNGHRSALGIEDRPLKEDLRRSRVEAQALGGELGDIAADVRFLLQKEAQLARAEVQETLNTAVRSLIWGGIAAFLAVPLVMFVFVTLMLALDTAMPLVAAAAITTGVILLLVAIAGALAYSRIKSMNVKPERTVKSLQEDIEWAKTRIRSTAR